MRGRWLVWLIFAGFLISGLLAACASQQDALSTEQKSSPLTMTPTETSRTSGPLPTTTLEMELMPVPTNDTWQDLAPQPKDAELPRTKVFAVKAEATVQDGEVWLHLQGQLPTPCHRLRVEVTREEDTLLVHVYAVLLDPNAMCIQTLKPFNVHLRLDVPPTNYTVKVKTP